MRNHVTVSFVLVVIFAYFSVMYGWYVINLSCSNVYGDKNEQMAHCQKWNASVLFTFIHKTDM